MATAQVESKKNGWDAQEIVDGVFLGSADCLLCDPENLISRNIGRVLSAVSSEEVAIIQKGTAFQQLNGTWPGGWKHLDAGTTVGVDLLGNLQDCVKFIRDGAKKNENVLVHCWAGESTSAVIVCAYLMTYEGLSPTGALELVRNARYGENSNATFLEALQQYAYLLKCTKSKKSCVIS
mmetsp:Transcript_30095/g.41976  ORF Transcript_30095/g.41976 Transcript_30095/m.41976 type:complete len:179 (-) Transcript_30095:308-844(-)|eukprot:CAMPEP_0175092026 /NCGR_PEP_ID=MMETSP0086_2-20121207/2233_1 /TAXON_ID=136419 /ORGANISM="Unknown Unknown, Strain D1" /LENGTH=178 /DNA_ID=CAMNT_0016364841 /DNA_START=25 /DNA_END=561 /DNA_ORIENTATION=-